MSISPFLKNRMVLGRSYGEFSEPSFHHNFAKNDRHDLKLGSTPATICAQNWGLKLIFLTKLWQF
jgi:hypothetical protein